MKMVDAIIAAEIFLSASGVLLGLVYLIRGSSWKTLPMSARTVFVIFVLTLVAAAAYTHSLLNAASQQSVVQKKISTLSDAIRLNPTANIYTRRAEALAATGEGNKALRDVERAIAI